MGPKLNTCCRGSALSGESVECAWSGVRWLQVRQVVQRASLRVDQLQRKYELAMKEARHVLRIITHTSIGNWQPKHTPQPVEERSVSPMQQNERSRPTGGNSREGKAELQE